MNFLEDFVVVYQAEMKMSKGGGTEWNKILLPHFAGCKGSFKWFKDVFTLNIYKDWARKWDRVVNFCGGFLRMLKNLS